MNVAVFFKHKEHGWAFIGIAKEQQDLVEMVASYRRNQAFGSPLTDIHIFDLDTCEYASEEDIVILEKS